MKLCIKQKAFSWRDKFYVSDEYGNDRYYVEGRVFGIGKRLTVYSLSGESLAVIKQKMICFTPTYTITVGAKKLKLIKRIAFLPSFRIKELDWDVKGNFFEHNYLAKRDGRQVFSVDKKWFSWGDCYMIDMPDGEDELAVLSVVLGIDCINDDESN